MTNLSTGITRLVTSRRARKAAAATTAALAAVAVLAGCSGGQASSTGGSAKSLTLWLSASSAQEAGYTQLASDYKAKTGVTVKIVNVPYSGFQTKLRDAAQANALPDVADVAALDPIWTNKLVDLSSIASASANHIDNDLVVTDSKTKRTIAIPSDITASGLFINKSLFEKAGVSFPTSPSQTWTWDEFIAAATKVREATGAKYDLTFDASPSRLRAMVYEMGGTYVHANSGGTFSTDAATKKAVQYFVSLNDDKVMPKSVWTSGADPSALFQSGQVVAYWSGVWQVSAFADSITKFDWASVPSPAQPTQASDLNVGGQMVAFDNNSAESTAAKKFLAYMYEPANYAKLAATNGYLPVETGLSPKYPFTSAAAQAAFKLYNEETPLYAPVSSYFSQAQTAWVLRGKSLTTDPSVTEMGKAINGQESVGDALKNIVAGYNTQVGGK